MRVKLILPYKTILDKTVNKVSAPGVEGDFQILPKHIDGTWSLKAGILVISMEDEVYFAIDQGVLVKEGDTVYISCFQAIKGDSLESLTDTVKNDLQVLNSREKKAREVLLRLETETIKRFIEIDN